MISARSSSVLLVVIILAVCAAAFVGCQPRGVFFDVRRPAKLTMPGVKTIAVVDLSYSDSAMDKRAAAYVKEALLNGIRKEKVLNVIDIKTLQEKGGQKIDGVITGEVWSTFTTEKDLFETALRTRETTAQDGFLTKVVESQDYVERIPYETVRAFLKVRLTLVTFKGKQEETRAILSESQGYRQKIGGIKSGGFFDLFGSSQGTQEPSLGVDFDPVIKTLAERVVPRFIATISPHMERVTVKFAENGDSRGLELVKRGRFEDAIAVLEKLCVGKQPTKDNAPDFYNLGLAHEAMGTRDDFDMAKDYYRKAIEGEPENPLYPEGLGRTEKLIRDYYKIGAQVE